MLSVMIKLTCSPHGRHISCPQVLSNVSIKPAASVILHSKIWSKVVVLVTRSIRS